MNTREKGFTLIELLVVIAIIGILAALVLVALGNARDKANDAKVKSDVSQLRTLAEIIYDTNGASYDNGTVGVEQCVASPGQTTCGDTETGASVQTLVDDIDAANGDGAAATAQSTSGAFCIAAQLRTNAPSSNYVCVDQTGEFVDGLSTNPCTDASPSCS